MCFYLRAHQEESIEIKILLGISTFVSVSAVESIVARIVFEPHAMKMSEQERGELRAKETRGILDRLDKDLEGPVARSVRPHHWLRRATNRSIHPEPVKKRGDCPRVFCSNPGTARKKCCSGYRLGNHRHPPRVGLGGGLRH